MRGIVYTIGHGSRSMAELCTLLGEHGIEVLVDVRRWPRSRMNPQFRMKVLERACTPG